MLENSVKPIDSLCVVKDLANQFQVWIGIKITNKQYFSLLLSESQLYDSQFATMIESKGVNRNLYNTRGPANFQVLNFNQFCQYARGPAHFRFWIIT